MNKPSPLLEGPRRAAEWVEHRERGSRMLLKAMVFVSIRFGRRLSRIFLYGIAIYFFLFGPTARRSALPYLRRALNRKPTMRDRFLQILYFATTIHDRVFLINRRFDVFNISVSGEGPVLNREGQRGALLIGAHLGSFEVIHSLGLRHQGLHVAMAMYEENARKISSILAAINPHAEADIVALGHLNAMLEISERLDRGQFVGVLGDRTLGEEAAQAVDFLGDRAYLPLGAMRAAAILRCPVFFMAGLYRGGNRYHVVFDQVADFSQVGTGGRKAAITQAVARYASLLERHCRSDPYNWFNFFDFWHARPQD
jgi:predicted LPLAT superfamily acyltransferase